MKTIAQQLKIKQFPFKINDNNGNRIYYEDSDGYWYKKEFDSNNNRTYYENSNGKIISNKPQPIPEYTMEELTKIVGKEFKIKK